jgi:MFS family permease
MGIGGEYAAINSAIDELIPARYRGRVDIAVNGTYWAGAILGTLGTFIFLNPSCSPRVGWRLAFLLGPVLGLVILFVRRHLPESPRWQVMHGREEEAERRSLHRARGRAAAGRQLPSRATSTIIEIKPRENIGYGAIARVCSRSTRAVDLGALADDHAVVPLQRDLLHLRAGADEVLRRRRQRQRRRCT